MQLQLVCLPSGQTDQLQPLECSSFLGVKDRFRGTKTIIVSRTPTSRGNFHIAIRMFKLGSFRVHKMLYVLIEYLSEFINDRR